MQDDFYSYPYPEHPAYSPPPDYVTPGQMDWRSETPASSIAPSGWRPLSAHLIGESTYSFLESVVLWLRTIRHDE